MLPYLALSRQTRLQGFELTPVFHGGGVDQPGYLTSILGMFLDGNGQLVDHGTFFEAEINVGEEDRFAVEVDRLVAALAFLLFDPDHPATSLNGNYLHVWMFEPRDTGFAATTNLRTYFDADPVSQRIYCGVPNLVPHYERIHDEGLSFQLLDPHHWPGEGQNSVLERLLLSMFWYSLSFSGDVYYEDRVALVNLATAFEVLFDVGESNSKRRLILDGLETLFGLEPVLGTWLSQFYSTRSEVVHEGKSPDLLFQYPGAGEPHRNLLTTGQRLYRAAVEEYMYCHACQVPMERPPTARFREAFLLDMVPNEVRLEQMAATRSGDNELQLITLAGDLRFDDGTGCLASAISAGHNLMVATRDMLDSNGLKAFRLKVEHARSADAIKQSYHVLGTQLCRAIRIPSSHLIEEKDSPWKVARSLRHFAAWMVHAVDFMAQKSKSV